ncbi:MAG: type III PLP-dependent enzyme [Paracoccaceae bacterium]
MGHPSPLWTSGPAYLRAMRPDRPVFFVSPGDLGRTASRLMRGFPGLVSYALKANPDPVILENLSAAGIGAFDVASPAECRLVRSVVKGATLHYNNPVRSPAEIVQALRLGVRSFSVDRVGELAKLASLATGPEIEISVRLALPVGGAAYEFGTKFGASPDLATHLLAEVAKSGFTPSMTFHPGTQCTDPAAWETYISACARIANRAGVRLWRLNVGGGFPSNRRQGAPTDIEAIFTAIRRAVAREFSADAPALLCEPGRALVADSIALATRIRAIGDKSEVFLNDGVYGGLAEAPSIGLSDRLLAVSPFGARLCGPSKPRKLFGPTCDSLDTLPGNPSLPVALKEGDYLIFLGAGAYSAALATGFNGYGGHERITVMRLA